jgi:hypothetical protein
MKPKKAPPLSRVLASHEAISPRHALRLIKAGDGRVKRALAVLGTPGVEAIGQFVMSLAREKSDPEELQLERLKITIAAHDTTVPAQLRRRIKDALATLMAAELAYDRALALWHRLDVETSGTGLLRDVALEVKAYDAEAA